MKNRNYWNEPMSRKNWAEICGLSIGLSMFMICGMFSGFKHASDWAKKVRNIVKIMVTGKN